MAFEGQLLVVGGGFIGTSILMRYPSAVMITRGDIPSHRCISWPKTPEEWKNSLKTIRPEGIIVCFGSALVKDIQKNPDATYKEQILKILALLDGLNNIKNVLKLKKIIIVGSAAEYGSLINMDIFEEATPTELSTYGCLKLSIHHICNFYVQHHHLPICYVRQFNTSGAGQSSEFVVPSLVSQYLSFFYGHQNLMQVGDLEIYRDFIHIEDVVEGYDILLEKGEPGQCYNLCSGKVHQIKEVLDYLSNKFGKLALYKILDDLKREENIKKNYISGSNEKLKKLGWSPKRTLEDIIENIIEHQRKIKQYENDF